MNNELPDNAALCTGCGSSNSMCICQSEGCEKGNNGEPCRLPDCDSWPCSKESDTDGASTYGMEGVDAEKE